MHKQLCACGCGELVTSKVESQHINAFAPAVLTSQVLDQNQRSIRWKKRSQAIGFSTPFCRRLAIGNTTEIDVNSFMMMGEDPNYEVCQSRSGRSQCIAPHAGPLGLMHDHEDIIMDGGGQMLLCSL
jgi:hypothetical protein